MSETHPYLLNGNLRLLLCVQPPKQGNAGSSKKAVPSGKREHIPTTKVSPFLLHLLKFNLGSNIHPLFLTSEISVVLLSASSLSTN